MKELKLIKKYILFILFYLSISYGQDYSINFDGNNDYILIQDHNQLDLTENYTIEAWIFPESFTWLAGIVSKYQTSGANGYLLRLTDQAPYDGISFDEKNSTTGVLNSNQWYHLAAVNDQGNRKLYINGFEVSLSGSSLNVSANSNPLRIGSDYGSRFFDGRIDEVRLWNIPRTQSEINDNMNQDLSGSELNLIAYYTFNEGSGDTLFDNSINNHHGLLRGSPNWVDGHTLTGLIGDVNFDESINIYDAVMLVSIMLNYETGTPLQIYACDINQDNMIDILDIILLIQMVMDLDTADRQILTNVSFSTINSHLIFESDGPILGFEIILSDNSFIEENQLPSSWSWNQKDNKIIAFSLDGSSLPTDFKIPIKEQLQIKKITLAGWGKKSVNAIKNIFPKSFQLRSGPNPFNPKCKILFTLYSQSNIQLKIFDITGRLVDIIFSGNMFTGEHSLNWTPNNVSSGTYFIQITDGTLMQTSKVIYLK